MKTPLYTHDCDNCVYVGRFMEGYIEGDGYICRTSVIWRTGDYGGDYLSMPIGSHSNSLVLDDIYNTFAMRRISEILYPNGDPDHEWSSNELEWIAEVVNEWNRANA